MQARADYIDIWRIKVASEGEKRTANALGWIRKSVSPTSSISAWMCSGTGGAGQDAEADGDGDASRLMRRSLVEAARQRALDIEGTLSLGHLVRSCRSHVTSTDDAESNQSDRVELVQRSTVWRARPCGNYNPMNGGRKTSTSIRRIRAASRGS